MLGSPILYLKGTRIMMFQLSGFYCKSLRVLGVLGGSWVVRSGVISPSIWAIRIVILLITRLITTHEPPSGWVFGFEDSGSAQRIQYPLVQEYSLNHIRDPTI